MSSRSNSVERLGCVSEVRDVEDGLGVRELEGCETSVESCLWGSEVGNSGGGGEAGACEDDDGFYVAGLDGGADGVKLGFGGCHFGVDLCGFNVVKEGDGMG